MHMYEFYGHAMWHEKVVAFLPKLLIHNWFLDKFPVHATYPQINHENKDR